MISWLQLPRFVKSRPRKPPCGIVAFIAKRWTMCRNSRTGRRPIRAALKVHLRVLATALHDGSSLEPGVDGAPYRMDKHGIEARTILATIIAIVATLPP